MSDHFVYIWRDKVRNMFYIGSHSGSIADNYISSSKWLTAEIRYRPNDFRRKILKKFDTKTEAVLYEYKLIGFIKENEYGLKYYNLKQGKPKGIAPWNAGKKQSQDHNKKISEYRKGKPTTKGRPNPLSAENGRKGALKLSAKVTGRKLATREDGTKYWVYPEAS
jgi:hypothetical protein